MLPWRSRDQGGDLDEWCGEHGPDLRRTERAGTSDDSHGNKPDAVVFDPATRTLWIMNPGSGDITVVDPATAAVLATVLVGGSLELGAADGPAA